MRALVVGAGSGRDIASAVLVTEQLRADGWQVDLAGFLTPWALHRFGGRIERAVNRLERPSEKFVGSTRLESYFEPALARLNEPLGLGIGRFYGFSLQHGTPALEAAVQRVVDARRYERIVLADVGGDVLAAARDLRNVLTPIVDGACLRSFARIGTRAERLVTVVGAGCDGELAPDELRAALVRLRPWTVAEERLDPSSPAALTLAKLNRALDGQGATPSGTSARLAGAMRGARSVRVRRNVSLPWGRRTLTFHHPVDPEIASGVYTFRLEGVARSAPRAPDFATVLDAQRWYRPRCAGTEVDLAFMRAPRARGAPLFSLTPCDRLAQDERARLLRDGAGFVRQGRVALVLRQDLVHVPTAGIVSEALDRSFAILRPRP